MREIQQTFKALSDTNRIRILKMLQVKPLCVCEITDILNLATSTVSKHLSILKEAGFIIDEKDGKWVNYRLDESNWNPYSAEISVLLKSWVNSDAIIRQDREKLKEVDRYSICAS